MFALETTTTAKIVGVVLVICGIGVAVFTYFYWKVAKPEPESLAPLEVMSAKRFAKSDPLNQQLLLDEVRPEGSSAPKETVRMAMQAVIMATQAEKIEAARLEAERAEREARRAQRAADGDDDYRDDEVDTGFDDMETKVNKPIDPLLG